MTTKYLLVLSLFACGTEAPVGTPRPTTPPTTTPEPATPTTVAKPAAPIDRSTDPKFALKKAGDAYVGLVLDRCPDGAVERKPDNGFKLVGTQLEMELFFGGCPTWTGYSVVHGTGSPLPFYLCVDIRHDMCEMMGSKRWVFELGDALAANHATAVDYAVPAGVP